MNIGITQDRVVGEEQDSHQFITDRTTRDVYRSQFQIGWRQIYLGRFHKRWQQMLIDHKAGDTKTSLTPAIGIMWSSYSDIAAWLDSVKRIYPDQYNEARENMNLTGIFEKDAKAVQNNENQYKRA